MRVTQNPNTGETLLYEKPDMRFWALLLLAASIMIAAGTYVAIHSSAPALTAAAWIILLLFGCTAVIGILPAFTLWLMSQSSPMIKLNADRFWYRGIGLAWREIADIEIARYMLTPWVSIRLQSSEALLNALPPYAAHTWARTLRATKGRLIIPAVRGMSLKEQRDLFNEYWEHNRHDPEHAPLYSYDKWSSHSMAAGLGAESLGLFLAVKWPSLVLCLRLHYRFCTLVDLAMAVGVACLTYFTILTVLRLVIRRYPTFDFMAGFWRLSPYSWVSRKTAA